MASRGEAEFFFAEAELRAASRDVDADGAETISRCATHLLARAPS